MMFAMFLAAILQAFLFSKVAATGSKVIAVNVTGNVVSQTVQFSNSSPFFDLSQYNFAKGRKNTYEYTLKARTGKQVFIYFYTQLKDNAIVEVYDGLDDRSKQLNLSKIDSVVDDVYYNPPLVKSTSGVLFIRIRAFNELANIGMQDFQALATDYQNPGSCTSLIWACSVPDTRIDYTFFGEANSAIPCLTLLHATDTNNDIRKVINVNRTTGNFTMKLFKGLNWSPAAEINTDVAQPIYVFDKYIIFEYTNTLPFTTTWNIQGNLFNLPIDSNYSSMLMSPDFLPGNIALFSGQQIHQTFNINPVNNQKPGIDISFQAPMISGVLSVSAIIGNSEVLLTTLSNVTNIPSTYSYPHPFDRIIVQYENNITNSSIAYGNGFYAIARAIDAVQDNGSNRSMILLPILLMIGSWFL